MEAPAPRHPMPVERPTTLYLNDQELLTIQTTPVHLHDWAVGFLFSEGLIRCPDAIGRIAVDADRGLVWVDLTEQAAAEAGAVAARSRRYITSGCGKGVTFSSIHDALQLQPIAHNLQVRKSQLLHWMKQMAARSDLYRQSGGMHAAAAVRVSTGEMILREDIGRHNAVDKVVGAVLKAGWPPSDLVMLTSGRISYEMCSKLARLGVGVGVSRTAATDQAFRLAVKLGIDLVGYVRSPRSIRLYTPGERVVDDGVDDLAIKTPNAQEASQQESQVDRRDPVWI